VFWKVEAEKLNLEDITYILDILFLKGNVFQATCFKIFLEQIIQKLLLRRIKWLF